MISLYNSRVKEHRWIRVASFTFAVFTERAWRRRAWHNNLTAVHSLVKRLGIARPTKVDISTLVSISSHVFFVTTPPKQSGKSETLLISSTIDVFRTSIRRHKLAALPLDPRVCQEGSTCSGNFLKPAVFKWCRCKENNETKQIKQKKNRYDARGSHRGSQRGGFRTV